MKKLRILVLMHEDLVPPDSIEGLTDAQIQPFKTEWDVTATLEEIGHEIHCLGVQTDLGAIRKAIMQFKPDICFNMLEEFHYHSLYDQHVVAFLELMKQRYTGCNPRGLTLAHDKALSKKVLAYHRIRVPQFAVFPMGRKPRRPPRLKFPMLVKSLTAEGSVGISQASVVHDENKLIERVHFIHRHISTDAIAEQYIEGREFYVGIIGNQRLMTFPIWELLMERLPPDAPNIATDKIKWDYKYQEKIGVKTEVARNISEEIQRHILHMCKRAYHQLGLTGYARMDLRMTPQNEVYLIEANPNPQLAYGEDFAESAESTGIQYPQLLQRIVNLGLRYRSAVE